MRATHTRRLKALEEQLRELTHGPESTDDERMSWPTVYPGCTVESESRAVVLEVFDFVGRSITNDGKKMWLVPCRAPDAYRGFVMLSFPAQQLLRDLLDVWGNRGGPHWFLRIIREFVWTEERYVAPLWVIRQIINRARLRRQFPKLLARFERDGRPRVDGYTGKVLPAWPEMAGGNVAVYNFISLRYSAWVKATGREHRRSA